MSRINIVRGDSKELLVSVDHEDKTDYDLSGLTVIFTAKSNLDDQDPVLQTTAQDTGKVNEKVLSFSPEMTNIDPGTYEYDIEMSNASRSLVNTLVIGKLTIIADVGRGSRE